MARKGKHWLTPLEVKNARKPGRLADGQGLYLVVSVRMDPDGVERVRRSWVYLYSLAGKRREMGLGSADALPLKEARKVAERLAALVAAGVDPLDDRKAKREAAEAERARAITFKEAALQYIEAHKPGWKNPKHGKLWQASLETHAFGLIGSKQVAAITLEDVLSVVQPLWTKHTETASRVRGRIETILAWCAVRGFRDRNALNPAAWRNNLDKLLPPRSKVRKVRHHAALDYRDAPAFMADLRARDGVGALALEFTILTCVRTGEALGAKWSEFDLEAGVWTIPEQRTKMDRAQRVVLSKQALAVLEKAKALGSKTYVFEGVTTRKPLSNMAMLQTLDRMGRRGAMTTHGCRAMFRTWLGEATEFPPELGEAALGHVAGDRTERAYARGDLLERRRAVMAAWANYLDRPAKPADIVPIEAGRKRAVGGE